MAPVTRRAAGSDAAAAAGNAPQEGGAGGHRFGRLVVGETDEYDAPPPAPRLHAALLVVAVLPLCMDVPVSVAIVATATLAILAGAWRSVKAAPPTETMTQKDAMRFPLIGRRVAALGWRPQPRSASLVCRCCSLACAPARSCFLVGLFLLFKFLPKDLVNAILSAYFVFLVRQPCPVASTHGRCVLTPAASLSGGPRCRRLPCALRCRGAATAAGETHGACGTTAPLTHSPAPDAPLHLPSCPWASCGCRPG